MMAASNSDYNVVDKIGQSPRLSSSQLSKPVADTTFLRHKTILVTGGASGFGAGFFRRWAAAGAHVIIGDINVEKGDQLVREVKKHTGNENLHFFHCDVTDWQSQVSFFKNAVKVSPHGGLDMVVANAGIADPKEPVENPQNIDTAEPPPPDLKVLDVNLKGVIYTTHLALWYLPRNPGSVPATQNTDPAKAQRDRHLVLMSSMAGLGPVPGQTLYAASKHGVVGLYRSLRATSFVHGVRTSLICPYFIDTPLVTVGARILLAGGMMGKPEDVVEAGTRFAVDPSIVGRAVVVGPKLKCRQEEDGKWTLVEKNDANQEGEETAIQEIYSADFEETELFTKNLVGLINRATQLRGWAGYFGDMFRAIKYGLGW